jgi:hypothetical protein
LVKQCSCNRLCSAKQLATRNRQLGLGAVAQLGERLVCNQEATGSIPVSSTKFNPMLGVKRNHRDSVHGSRKLLGAEHWVGKYPNPLRRVSQRKLARTNFDN